LTEPESTASVEHTGKQPIKEPEIEPKKSAVIEAPDPLPESIPDTAPEPDPLPEEPEVIDSVSEDVQADTLPDCHGKILTVQERDMMLLKVEKLFPGKLMNQVRADALNAAGILTGRGKPWESKAVGDNLRLAKIRAEK